MTRLAAAFFRRPAPEVARDLLGRYVVHEIGGERLVLRVVETEAYLGSPDRASHAWNDRRTERTASLFRPGGRAYVYFIYGMHHMLNMVTGDATDGSAVLIRAGECVQGCERMAANRGRQLPAAPAELAGGPGKLCQAMAVDLSHDGASLLRGPLTARHGELVGDARVVRGPRVGVDYAAEAAAWPMRFAIRGHRDVSRPLP